MSIQAVLNETSLDYLPRIQKHIKEANEFEANQMRQRALREMQLNTRLPIDTMDAEQLESFQDFLEEIFTEYRWINNKSIMGA